MAPSSEPRYLWEPGWMHLEEGDTLTLDVSGRYQVLHVYEEDGEALLERVSAQ